MRSSACQPSSGSACVNVLCLYSYGRLWSVCEVDVVPCADAVVAVTVMYVLLFVLHVCMCIKNGKSGPHYCWRKGSTQFAQQFVTAVTDPPLVDCVIWILMMSS